MAKLGLQDESRPDLLGFRSAFSGNADPAKTAWANRHVLDAALAWFVSSCQDPHGPVARRDLGTEVHGSTFHYVALAIAVEAGSTEHAYHLHRSILPYTKAAQGAITRVG